MNYLKSRSQYVCENCVKSNQEDEAFAKVLAILEKEMELKEALKNSDENTPDNASVNSSHTEDLVAESMAENSTHPVKHQDKPATQQKQEEQKNYSVNRNEPGNTNQTSKQRKDKVCYFYKNNKCKYGLIGRDCPYAHPRLCYKYKVNGCDPVRGCKKGKNCIFLHPQICFGSERRRECLNMECKRLHLKGTRRYPPDQVEQLTHHQATSAKQLPAQQTIPLPAAQSQNAWAYGPRHQTAKQQSTTAETFLLQQMQHMQEVQQQILQALKTVTWQWSPMHPLQGQQQQQQVTPMPTASIK